MKKHQWGIADLGTIAHESAESSNQETDKLTIVTLRTPEKVENFAHRYSILGTYGNYQEMLDDAEIDIVYVAIPNRQHIDHILAALEAGKYVLCEKATAMNKKELADATRLAEEKNLILVEVITIFNMPLYQQLRSIVDTGKLGALKMIQVSFGNYKEPGPRNRFFNPELARGVLLDVGTCTVSLAYLLLNSQLEVVASTMISLETGVGEQSVTILCSGENELVAASLTFQVKVSKVGIVAFENGYVTIVDYLRADHAEILFTDGTREFIESGNTSEVVNYEIKNMVYMIEGDLPDRSLFLTKDVIEILGQMQVL